MKGEKYLFVVSGPSGTGKDTVVAALLKKHPEIQDWYRLRGYAAWPSESGQ